MAASVPARPNQPQFVSSTSISITLEFEKVVDNGGAPVSRYGLYVDRGNGTYNALPNYNG